jgi:hypothetical protein
MSCVLRASGFDFDVVTFLASCELEPIKVFKKGEPRFPTSQPDGPKRERSGLNFEVSGADFSELALQMEEALAFVRRHQPFISKLKAFPGVENVTIDFGAEIHPPGWYSFTFSSDLMLAVGVLGISLELSVYPVEEEDDESA